MTSQKVELLTDFGKNKFFQGVTFASKFSKLSSGKIPVASAVTEVFPRGSFRVETLKESEKCHLM
jgi:hypothetical protein